MSRIELDSVSKIYPNGVKAVDEVAIDIQDGEFMVLVGPSGCGKSTLLRMIAGLEEVTEGSISIGDRDVTEMPPQKRDIAMVFQDYALYPHMTVRENLAYGLKLKKMPKAEWRRRVDEVAKTLGLEDLLERKPAKLSGRMPRTTRPPSAPRGRRRRSSGTRNRPNATSPSSTVASTRFMAGEPMKAATKRSFGAW